MKKILLSAVALVAAMSVDAQEIGAITQATVDALGVGTDAVALTGGTEVLSTTSVKMSIKYDDSFKSTGLSKNNVKVGETDFGSETGIQGSTNGPAAALTGSYPETGCIYHFDVAKDGYLYIIHKGTNSKGYVVYEEKTARPAYTFAMTDGTTAWSYDLASAKYPDIDQKDKETGEVIGKKYPAGEAIAEEDPEGGYYVIDNSYAIPTPQEMISGMGSGTSVIKFQVFEGLQYDIMATGSKMTIAGFIFDETGTSTITAGDVTLLNEGCPTGINNINKKVIDINSAIFNIAGQQVDNNYKGLVIKNGQKMIQK